MALQTINAFLVRPGKGVTNPEPIAGNDIPLDGAIYDMLSKIFDDDPQSRDFEITFKMSESGEQQNDCRDLCVLYCSKPGLENGLLLAKRLQDVSDNRPGIGLLFILHGTRGINSRLLIARFPADQAILAEVGDSGLGLEFLQQVFIKRMAAYKAVLFDDRVSSKMYWKGIATDKQAGGAAENISHYWLEDFLTADFSETPAHATKRLADALKAAVKSLANISAKSEITSAVNLASNALDGKVTSIAKFCDHFGFSQEVKSMIQKSLAKPALFERSFKFDAQEFKGRLPYRTDELSNGAMITAPAENFEDIIEVEKIDDGAVRYSTTSTIKDHKMGARR